MGSELPKQYRVKADRGLHIGQSFLIRVALSDDDRETRREDRARQGTTAPLRSRLGLSACSRTRLGTKNPRHKRRAVATLLRSSG